MNAPLRQTDRLGRLTTVLGPEALALLRFDGTDHVNENFEYRVEALSTSRDLDFDTLLGTHATVEIEGREGPQAFDGIVTQARWAGVGENGHRYDLTLRPWFWLAGRRRNQRIFHDQTVVQILQTLLSDYAGLGEPALHVSLTRDYPVLEYTVQYRESDMDFARRQMERAGISFHFAHKRGSHTMVLTDSASSHDEIGSRPFKSYDGHHQAEGEHFWEWAPERNLTTGAVRLTDYNFKQPDQAMEVDRQGDAAHAEGRLESYDYPGDYPDEGAGRGIAGLRIAAERGGDKRNRAVGDCVSLRAGRRVGLSGDPVPGTGETFLCLSASHHFVSEAYGSGGEGSDGYAFTGAYTLMPDDAPLMPPRRSPIPVVHGPQTATVVGEGEIDCDEYGRILVRFHWDLDGAISMRCRVSQNWAGAGWGGIVIPRIGMEVVVEFLEGDPDKPLVTGCVYNGRNGLPYPLPANKTVSSFRSTTHQGGGFNELRFEDQSGREEVFMHAQKDHNTVIENDESHTIGHDRSKSVANNQSESVGNDKTIGVGNNHTETIGVDKVLSVGSNHTESIGADMALSVAANRTTDVGQNRTSSIGADETLSVGGNQSVSVTGNASLGVGGDQSVGVDQNRTLSVGIDDTSSIGGAQSVAVTGERSVSAAAQSLSAENDFSIVSQNGSVLIRAASTIVLDAPNIVLKSDGANFISIGGGQIVVEGGQTYINPRESSPV
ncbi:type VI secretion system tip protein VgrG [Paracoccus sp. TK19116]|uniref:Type VI secretion system tip protein VgrG n=1 Tax=Paracoccus albicereus TaxID=2922394 RepID=A0ABT1MRU4_9RHOB|nr:type VI secretion system tip protein TssI/VgrG [Paracoccus albicereus]MCQ0970251.1 type VI secretion system tip protein VgrG [Paracoccus albicereus]